MLDEAESLSDGADTVRLPPSLLSAAIEASDACVSIADMTRPDAPLIYVNNAFTAVTGYARDEALRANCRFLQGPDTDPETVRAMRRALDAGQSLKIELLNYRKSGEPFWNELHLSPVRSETGEVTAFVGVQHDVTRARQARASEQHRQRIEALGRMAGGMAHEINNLLQPMLTLPDLIADDLPASAARSRADLTCLQDSARQARDLVAQILSYTRLAGSEDTEVAVAPAVREALHVLACGRSAGRTVELTAQIDDRVRVRGLTKHALQQVLTNLVINALDASQGAAPVTVSLTATPAEVRLAVADQGSGMTPETVAKLFEPFFTTKPVGEGTGLGLYVVHDLIHRAGGRIDLETAPGQGATFTLVFQRADDAHA